MNTTMPPNSTDKDFGTYRVDTRMPPDRMTWMTSSAPHLGTQPILVDSKNFAS